MLDICLLNELVQASLQIGLNVGIGEGVPREIYRPKIHQVCRCLIDSLQEFDQTICRESVV